MVSCPSGCGQSDVVISGEHVQQLAIHTTELKDYIYIYICDDSYTDETDCCGFLR
jgi:hypothetical protein